MVSGSSSSLVQEMLEVPGILRRFDEKQAAVWATEIGKKKRLFVTGEGSSRIFPAKNLMDRALCAGCAWDIRTEGARQAAEYNLSDFIVLAASNSGRTRETVALFEKLAAEGVTRYAVIGQPGSRLEELATDSLILSCGAEKAVAATKSVVEQALVWQSLLGGNEWQGRARAVDGLNAILRQSAPPEVAAAVNGASALYFAGRNDGVAEELALKAGEIARKKGQYLEGTYALHGVEETMDKTETVVLIEPFRAEMEKYRDVLVIGVGMQVVAISSFDTPFPTFRIPQAAGFDACLQLAAGWNLLVAAGLAGGVDIDRPRRVRKVGNEI